VVAENGTAYTGGTFLAADAEATTDANGNATLELYDTTWTIGPKTNLEEVNPPGTSVQTVAPGSGGYNGYQSICRDGGVVHLDSCVYHLDPSQDRKLDHEMTVILPLVEVNVTLPAGLGLGQVRIHNAQMTLLWSGQEANAPLNRPRFFVLQPTPAVVHVNGFTGGGASPPAQIAGCTPGQTAALPPPEGGFECVLNLGGGSLQYPPSPGGAFAGSVSFGA
jgi:hypothetical protein